MSDDVIDDSDQLDAIRREGERILELLTPEVLSRPIAACPAWQMRDLVVHLGRVQRWATLLVSGARATAPSRSSEGDPALEFDANELGGWLREGLDALEEALRNGSPETATGAFFGDADSLTFWRRRQLHELVVHRVDVEDAAAQARSTLDPELSCDGIDELLFGFGGRFLARFEQRPASLIAFEASDVPARWDVRLGPGARYERVEPGGGADLVIRARAAELYLFAWNRSAAVLPLGATDLIEVWRADAHV